MHAGHTGMARIWGALALAVAVGSCLATSGIGAAKAADAQAAALSGSLANLPGRWAGEGRLGFKDGKAESVTCRATYFAATDAPGLKQTIRCASASGKIELKSRL